MNIYCVIFMCTFGANNTDTEMPVNNSLIGGPNGNSRSSSNGATASVDVAKLILPERGELVPQKADIVMDLPNLNPSKAKVSDSAALSSSSSGASRGRTVGGSPVPSPTLSEILLPPSFHSRNKV